jgi:zinc and cadmium transporter
MYTEFMETSLVWAVLSAAVVALVSLSGVLFSFGFLGHFMKRNLKYLASFSGGVFMLVVYHLLEETVHESESLALVAGSVLFGVALMQTLHHLIPEAQHHHHHDTAHDHTHSSIDGRRVLLTDGIHNIGDGVLLVASYAVSIPIGIAATIGIVIHELVQEISEYFVLREAGYSSSQALGRNLISASTIFLGVGLAAFLSSAHEIAILFAGIAAGGFLAIVLQDLLPHAIGSTKSGASLYMHALAAIAGVLLMIGVQSLTPHEEREEEELAIVSALSTVDTVHRETEH